MDYIISKNQPSASEFSYLRAKVGWGDTNLNMAQCSLDNSLFHVTAHVTSKLIGMGRVIGDGVMFFYVQDLVVDPDFQKQGISTGSLAGKKIMSIILVSDVFGVTPPLLEIAKKLGARAIIDPYEGQVMGFESEADAYSYFVKKVGLDSYLSILLKAVGLIQSPITLISFSVGASVVWRLSEIKDHNFIKQAFCYYGSQIRNFTKIEPRFKINVVFPVSEAHFDVVELQNSLSTKKNVATKKVKYLHGFMNYYSSNYSEYGYMEQIAFLRSTDG